MEEKDNKAKGFVKHTSGINQFVENIKSFFQNPSSRLFTLLGVIVIAVVTLTVTTILPTFNTENRQHASEINDGGGGGSGGCPTNPAPTAYYDSYCYGNQWCSVYHDTKCNVSQPSCYTVNGKCGYTTPKNAPNMPGVDVLLSTPQDPTQPITVAHAVAISWTKGQNVTDVNLTTDPNFNSYWRKTISDSTAYQTTYAPESFVAGKGVTGSFSLKAGQIYYVRVGNSASNLYSDSKSFIVDAKAITPGANALAVPDIVYNPPSQCSNNPVNTGFSISWADPHVSWIDIGLDIDFNTYYHKAVSCTTPGSCVTLAPEDFVGAGGGASGPLLIKPNTDYFVRLYDTTTQQKYSGTNTLRLSSCVPLTSYTCVSPDDPTNSQIKGSDGSTSSCTGTAVCHGGPYSTAKGVSDAQSKLCVNACFGSRVCQAGCQTMYDTNLLSDLFVNNVFLPNLIEWCKTAPVAQLPSPWLFCSVLDSSYVKNAMEKSLSTQANTNEVQACRSLCVDQAIAGKIIGSETQIVCTAYVKSQCNTLATEVKIWQTAPLYIISADAYIYLGNTFGIADWFKSKADTMQAVWNTLVNNVCLASFTPACNAAGAACNQPIVQATEVARPLPNNNPPSSFVPGKHFGTCTGTNRTTNQKENGFCYSSQASVPASCSLFTLSEFGKSSHNLQSTSCNSAPAQSVALGVSGQQYYCCATDGNSCDPSIQSCGGGNNGGGNSGGPSCTNGQTTSFTLTVTVPGIGQGKFQNNTPKHTSRNVKLEVVDLNSNKTVKITPKDGTFTLNSDGTITFTNVNLGSVLGCGGQYKVRVTVPGSLKVLSDQELQYGQDANTNKLTATLLPGDIVDVANHQLGSDNQITIEDYNVMAACQNQTSAQFNAWGTTITVDCTNVTNLLDYSDGGTQESVSDSGIDEWASNYNTLIRSWITSGGTGQ